MNILFLIKIFFIHHIIIVKTNLLDYLNKKKNKLIYLYYYKDNKQYNIIKYPFLILVLLNNHDLPFVHLFFHIYISDN